MNASKPYQTTRIWKSTHRRLRVIAAHTGESIVKVLDRLARKEFQRLHLPEPASGHAHEQTRESLPEEG